MPLFFLFLIYFLWIEYGAVWLNLLFFQFLS